MFNTLIFLAFLGRVQPPPRGCVLKLTACETLEARILQPPPRGCVLKQRRPFVIKKTGNAAASARLCVETDGLFVEEQYFDAAASARLCVETWRIRL